jgi:DNA modification methylase
MKSVVSYPVRGEFGDKRYRGNCSGFLVKDLLEHFKPSFVFDPMEGSGTTGDVCKEMGIRYMGMDIRNGFNLLEDDLPSERPDFIFFHPPYWNIIPYTQKEGDISNIGTYPEFMRQVEACIKRLVGILADGGTLCILIGDKRHEGKYYPMAADLVHKLKWNGEVFLKSIVIKAQHNTASERIDYKGNFIPIQHEYCLVLKKRKYPAQQKLQPLEKWENKSQEAAPIDSPKLE